MCVCVYVEEGVCGKKCTIGKRDDRMGDDRVHEGVDRGAVYSSALAGNSFSLMNSSTMRRSDDA